MDATDRILISEGVTPVGLSRAQRMRAWALLPLLALTFAVSAGLVIAVLAAGMGWLR